MSRMIKNVRDLKVLKAIATNLPGRIYFNDKLRIGISGDGTNFGKKQNLLVFGIKLIVHDDATENLSNMVDDCFLTTIGCDGDKTDVIHRQLKDQYHKLKEAEIIGLNISNDVNGNKVPVEALHINDAKYNASILVSSTHNDLYMFCYYAELNGFIVGRECTIPGCGKGSTGCAHRGIVGHDILTDVAPENYDPLYPMEKYPRETIVSSLDKKELRY